MREFYVAVTILLIFISCSQRRNNVGINERIHYVENNLFEFTTNAGMFRPDSTQLANPKKLTERMEYYKVPGVSISVINKYQIEWNKAFGIMDANTKEPVNTETIFEAASTSKFITAVLILHFVQQGVIDLDQNINNYLKSWQMPENEFTKKEKVTIRRLLTHEAGLPMTNFGYDENIGIPTLLDVLNGKSPALNKPAIPEFIPGSQWQYSNVGYDVLQLLLEDLTGKTFQHLAQEVIFDPLGMKNSTFIYPLDSERKKREAMPHNAEGISLEPVMHLTAIAHGGLMTTPNDLAKFTQEIMYSYQGRSEKIILQKTVKLLFNKEYVFDPNIFGLPLIEGLGVFIMGEGKDFLFMHPGNNFPGLNCRLMGWPNRGTAVIIMTNGERGELLAKEIVTAINREYNNTTE